MSCNCASETFSQCLVSSEGYPEQCLPQLRAQVNACSLDGLDKDEFDLAMVVPLPQPNRNPGFKLEVDVKNRSLRSEGGATLDQSLTEGRQQLRLFSLKILHSELFKGFFVGAVGAMSGSAASAPFDVIKVRIQIQGELAVASAAGMDAAVSEVP